MISKSIFPWTIYGLLTIVLMTSMLEPAAAKKCRDICGQFKKVEEDDAQEKILSQSGNEMTQMEPDAEGSGLFLVLENDNKSNNVDFNG